MTIEEIKSRLNILQVAAHYGLKPDVQNRLLCVWHTETTPSLQLYPKTNTFCCFSSKCHAGTGDVIDFIMKYENTTKYQAILKAKSLIGENSPAPLQVQESPQQLNEQHRLYFLDNAFSYFFNGLKTSSIGNEYLQKRGLNRSELLANGVRMGYNSGQWIKSTNEELVKNAKLYGLLVQSENLSRTGGTGHNVFAKLCIMFPLQNKQGKVAGLYGRSVYDESKNKHYYLRDRQGLFPYYPNEQTKKLILTEAIVDAATLLQQHDITSVYSVLAAYGTNGLTQEHQQAIKELAELEEIIFFYDGDEAGREAVKKYAYALHQLVPKAIVSNVPTPDKEDVNSFFVTYGKDGLLQLLGEREILYSANEVIAEIKQTTTNEEEQQQSEFNSENNEALVYENNLLHILVLGGIKLSGLDRLRVTLKIKAKQKHYQPLRQNLDLYHSEQLTRLVRHINEQLEVSLSHTEKSIQELIEKLEQYRLERIGSLQPLKPQRIQLSESETAEALNYLKETTLMQNTMQDIGKTGIVGEIKNRLIMFLVFLSRITHEPLHLISFGSSGTGKTYLQENVAKLIPDEDKLEITTLSGNALYYFKQDEIKHKLLLIEDYDGAQEVLYPLRELQSKQKISKTVSLKDTKGNIRTLTFVVEGPVCIAGCTTKEVIYEDNANRSLLIYLDNSEEQDERIMDYQRALSAGKTERQSEEQYTKLLQNVQRILKPVRVVNPYAPCLKIPKNVLKPRRSNKLYLRFIELITLYHQYQREIKTDAEGQTYIETSFEDIAWANKLLNDILIRKSDELSAACRNFLERLKKHLKEEKKQDFKTKDIRTELRVHPSSLKKHLLELVASGYVKIAGGTKAKGFTYEINSYEEYEELQKGISWFLENLLETIKHNKGCTGSDETKKESE
jgi:DNA primase catalytic core